MKNIKNSGDRLRLFFLSWDLSVTYCDFDRRKNQADLISLKPFFPFKRVQIALSEIAGAEVKGHKRGSYSRYVLVLRFSRGRSMDFSCSTKDKALNAMRLIRTFLHIE